MRNINPEIAKRRMRCEKVCPKKTSSSKSTSTIAIPVIKTRIENKYFLFNMEITPFIIASKNNAYN
jgi:hypothetical protein